MARLLTTGFESRLYTTSLSTNGEGQNTYFSGAISPDTTDQWAGSCCAKFPAGESKACLFDAVEAGGVATGRSYYLQTVVKFIGTGVPSNFIEMLLVQSELGVALELGLAAGGKWYIWSGQNGGTEVQSSSPAELNRQYLVEMFVEIPNAAEAANWTVKITDAETSAGVYEASAKWTMGGKPPWFEVGHHGSDTNWSVCVSQFIINDSTGTKENSWVGKQKVVLLKPTSDESRVGWKTGSGGTTELYKAVSNFPPKGVANGSKTGTTQDYDAESTTTHEYKAVCQQPNHTVTEGGGGMVEGDQMKVMMLLARFSNSSGTARGFGVKSTFPSVIEKTASTSGTAGTEPTGWGTATTEPIYVEAENKMPGGLGYKESPRVVIRKNAASTDALACDMVGVYLSYLAGTTTPALLTLAPTGGAGVAAALKAPTALSAAAVGAGAASAALRAPSLLSVTAAGSSSAGVGLKAPSSLALLAAGAGVPHLALTARPLMVIAAPGSGAAAIALAAPSLLSAGSAGGSAAAMALAAPMSLALTAPGGSEAVLTLATSSVPMLVLTAAGGSRAVAAVTAPSALRLIAAGAGVATLQLAAAAELSLDSSGAAAPAAALTAPAALLVDAAGAGNAVAALMTNSVLSPGMVGSGAAAAALSAPTALTLEADGLSAAHSGLATPADLALAAVGLGSSTAALTAPAHLLLAPLVGEGAAAATVIVPVDLVITAAGEGEADAVVVVPSIAFISLTAAGAGDVSGALVAPSSLELGATGSSSAAARLTAPTGLAPSAAGAAGAAALVSAPTGLTVFAAGGADASMGLAVPMDLQFLAAGGAEAFLVLIVGGTSGWATMGIGGANVGRPDPGQGVSGLPTSSPLP